MRSVSLTASGDLLTVTFLAAGLFFTLAGSLGLVRLRDTYQRLHAPTKASTLGVSGILLASMLYLYRHTGTVPIKEALTIVFLMLTAPVSAHMLGRAAYRVGNPFSRDTWLDEWQEKRDLPPPKPD